MWRREFFIGVGKMPVEDEKCPKWKVYVEELGYISEAEAVRACSIEEAVEKAKFVAKAHGMRLAGVVKEGRR